MGQDRVILPAAAGVFLRRVDQRLRRERAWARLGQVGVPAATLVIAESLLARLVSVPDLRPAAATVLALVPGLAVLQLLRATEEHLVRRQAGEAAGSPALFLAAETRPPSRLHPLLVAQIARAAATADPGERPRPGPLARFAALLGLVALLAVIAPGRLRPPGLVSEAPAAALRDEARAAAAALTQPDLPADARKAAAAAIAALQGPALSAAEAADILRSLRDAAANAGADWKAFATAADSAALLRPLGEALRAADRERAVALARDLARRIAEGTVPAEERTRAGEALIAAVDLADDPALRALLERAGRSLLSGEGSGASESLVGLAERLHPPSDGMRRIANLVAVLESVVGTPSGEPSLPASGATTTSALAPRAGGAPSTAPYLGARPRLDPVHEAVLRRYFASR